MKNITFKTLMVEIDGKNVWVIDDVLDSLCNFMRPISINMFFKQMASSLP